MKRWNVLATMILEEKFTRFVEVGTKEGRTTAFVLEKCPDCHVIAMDPWTKMPHQAGEDCGETYEAWDFKAIEEGFWRLVEPHTDRLTFHRKTSEATAPLVEDGSQDLIFIDAAHDYKSVIADINRWLPKVRTGGILAGHDYQHSFPSVMRAVSDTFNLMTVQVAPDSVWWLRIT